MDNDNLSLTSGEDELNKFKTIASDRLFAGASQDEVVTQLVGLGMGRPAAAGLVAKLSGAVGNERAQRRASPVQRRAEQLASKQSSGKPLSWPIVTVAAFSAAIAGAIVWNLVTNISGYELGLIAWGIGGLTGFATRLFSNGNSDMRVQFLAVIAAIGGIILGKYLVFRSALQDAMLQIDDPNSEFMQAMAQDSDFALAMEDDPQFIRDFLQSTMDAGWSGFFADLPAEFGLFGALWIFLAVSTAWGIAGRE